jgi:hypothetical protein
MATASLVLEYAVAEDGEVRKYGALRGESIGLALPADKPMFAPVTDKVLWAWGRQALEGIAKTRFEVSAARMTADAAKIRPLSGFRVLSSGFAVHLTAEANADRTRTATFDVLYGVDWQFTFDGDTLLSVKGMRGSSGASILDGPGSLVASPSARQSAPPSPACSCCATSRRSRPWSVASERRSASGSNATPKRTSERPPGPPGVSPLCAGSPRPPKVALAARSADVLCARGTCRTD